MILMFMMRVPTNKQTSLRQFYMGERKLETEPSIQRLLNVYIYIFNKNKLKRRSQAMIIKVYNLISLWGQKRSTIVQLRFALNLISFPRLETSITRPWLPPVQYVAREFASEWRFVWLTRQFTCWWYISLSNEVNQVGDAIMSSDEMTEQWARFLLISIWFWKRLLLRLHNSFLPNRSARSRFEVNWLRATLSGKLSFFRNWGFQISWNLNQLLSASRFKWSEKLSISLSVISRCFFLLSRNFPSSTKSGLHRNWWAKLDARRQ